MLVSNEQAWVTSAVSNDQVEKALILCCSLRKAYTSRKVAVIASPKISVDLRKALYQAFDFVFYLDEDLNTARLKPDDFAKIYSLLVLGSFKNCAYLSPCMLALKSCDDIFDQPTPGFSFLKNSAENADQTDKENVDVFLFKPSIDHFKALESCCKKLNVNGHGIGTYLNKWAKNQFKDVGSLDGKYNKVMNREKGLVGYEHEISFVNLINYPTQADIDNLDKTNGILGKLVGIHWNKIRNDNVLPLIHGSNLTIPRQPVYAKEPIAIVGMSCRYPGANNLEEFWDLLFQGQDGTGNPPEFRWLREQSCRRVADARKTNAGFLKVPVDEFDGKFFGISPKEVLFMDPQHRLLHEVIWEGLEDACIDPHELRGSSGAVFLGSWLHDYRDILVEGGLAEFYRVYMGNSIGAATARLSFTLGLTGPSVATESGCSSAMVAVHLACRSLQNGETSLALAGGVNLLLHPFEKDIMPMVISADGHCKTFSEDANGFARAEGCGVLVLKRLSDALKDGDNVWGLIRGSAITQEGVSQSMGTPTVHCESLAMMEALKDAGVRPEEVSYVEAHGTGTIVGDPMEVAAITKAYRSPCRKEPLIVGSVKTNVGHTESCSGITGIMKVVLAMQNEAIPAHLHFSKLNPEIDLDAIPAVIPTELVPWKKVEGTNRLAGVSSFGITGTDAHVIIEETPQATNEKGRVEIVKNAMKATGLERPLHLLKVSAKTGEALDELLTQYKDVMQNSEESLSDIAYSSNLGRANFANRAVIIARTKEEVVTAIEKQKYLHGEASGDLGKVCFLFTGQGSQYSGMGKTLYDTSPVFKMHFDYCEKILKDTYKISLKNILWSSSEGNEEQISRTIYSQTAIFCVEYALLKLWESWGIKPDYCLGHSLGEFCAAVCAGLVSVEDAIKLVAERSRLIDFLPQGKMLVIQADYPEVQRKLSRFSGVGVLDFAAINSNQQTVVAGDSEVVLNFAKFLKEEHNIKCLVLAATHAFHSKHMDPMLEKYRKVAKTIKYQGNLAKCEYISGMRGDLVSSGNVDSEYWVQHTREKVNFLSASKKAVELGCQIFIEIGPQPVLSALTMINTEDTPTGSSLVFLPSLKRKEDEWTTILGTLGKLYLKGLSIDWVGYEQFYARQKIRGLPHYPFMGKKYWPDLMQVTGNSIHPLVGSVIPNASSTKIFQAGLNLRTQEYVKDHAIGQTVVFPGAGYLEMCLAAGLATVEGSVESLGKPSRPMKVENLLIKAPLALEEGKTCQVQTVAELNTSPDNPNDWNDVSIKIFQRLETNWLSHATATFVPVPSAEELKDLTGEFTQESFLLTLENPSNDDQVIEKGYEKLASIGLKFGPTFKSLEKLWREGENPKSLLAKVKVPSQQNDGEGYIIHPAVLDAMIQAIMMLNVTNKLKNKLYVPIRIGKFLWLSNSLTEDEDRYIHVFESSNDNKPEGTSGPSTVTALLVDLSGKVLALMADVELIDTTVKAVEAVLEQQTSQMTDLWEETWRPKMGPCQYRHDLTLCHTQEIYDEKYYQYIHETYNKMSPELAATFQNLEHMVYLNMLRALYKCGWEVPCLGETLQEDTLLTQFGIENKRSKMLRYLLRILEEEGILKQETSSNSSNDHWKLVRVPPTLSQINEQLSSPIYTEELVKMFNPTLLFAKVGENYSEILQGKQSALPILFPEETSNGGKREWPPVSEFYTEYGKLAKIGETFQDVISLQVNNCKPHVAGARTVMRALEFGAGTGSLTEEFMKIVDNNNLEVEYYYTDISAAFFPAAEKKFEKHAKHMIFKKLNVEEDPISQGFPPNYFDYIMASEVMHATKDIVQSLRNVKMLLRPGGQLCIQDMTRVSRPITYLFGLLDGFWRFEDFDLRQDHCTLSTDKWIECFKKVGLEVTRPFPALNNHHSFFTAYNTQEDIICPMVSYPAKPIEKSSKLWIVFHYEDSPTSNYLLEKLPSVENRHVVRVTRGQMFQSVNDGLSNWSFQVNPSSEQDFLSVIEAVNSKATVEGVLYCWSLDKTCKSQETLLQPYFHAIKAVLQIKQNQLPRLMSLVNGVYSLPVENNLDHWYATTISGMTKSLRNERIDFSHCCCLDIGGEDSFLRVTGEQIFLELWNADKEPQVYFHEKTRYIARTQMLKPSLSDLKLPGNCSSDRFQLILPETKLIDDLEFGPLEPLILEQGEIEIRVKTSALNFRDVFSVLKPTEKFKDCNAVGFDFAGVVKRVGPDATKWSVGDRVFGVNVNGAALPSHIKVHEIDVLPVPDGMSFADACTLPAVVATSYYCLVDVAKITSNDTVLIHTASGGVGLSAIEICKSVGCTMIATAGSNRKRNYLRSLGIRHVFHSRNTQYGEDILKVTNGGGVTVVLNSLTGEGFKEATLNCCAAKARFVEMSKLNVWTPEEVQALRPDVKYTIADLSSMEQPEWRRLLTTLRELADKKVVNPIPYVRFDGVHIREALQYMQKAKHIGKVVCVMPEVRLENGRGQVHTQIFNEEATYLITGGLGGIGFTVCRWMVEKGAKHVLLAGRNEPKPEMQRSINKLNLESGANVQAVQLDVGDFSQCRDLILRKIPEEFGLPPLRGIMHAAGTLNDGLIENQSWPKLSSTLNAKVNGSLNLHELTKTMSLEHFVLFSSMASMFGSPGQSNHAAGNHFEDTLAFYRNSIGLPATTINWGQWSEVGIATEIELPGVKPFSNLQGLTGLEFAMKSHRVQTGVVCIDSFVLFAKLFPRISSVMDERVWKSKIGGGATRAMNLQSAEFWQQYDSLETIEEKLAIAKEKIGYILKNILKLDESDVIEENTPFQEMGVDSLMFVELKNTLQSLLGSRITVNANALRDCNTLNLLSNKLVKLIEGEDDDLDDKIPTSEEVAQLIKEDCQLPEHIHSKPDQQVTDVSKISTVLVTGCTGTLGPYLLKEITANPQVTQVICLVRPTKTLSGEERLKNIFKERDLLHQIDMNKIRCVNGNVALENLGMEPIEWEELCNSVDAVFHSAASVQHVEHYRKREGGNSAQRNDMRLVNIGGTKNVLEFACTGSKLKHVYCASSLLAVATVDSHGTLNDDWPEPTDFDGVTTIAYPVTKFVCDVLLKQAVLERGIPAKVFRLPLIVGDSKTGQCVLEQNHYMLRYMFVLKNKIIPSNPVPVAMLPVDICAWASVNIFFNEQAPSDIYNICNKSPDTDQQFVEVASRLGYKVDIVEFAEFSKKIRETTEADSPLAIFKEIYKNDDDLMAMYSSAPALRHWLLEAGGDLSVFVSKKLEKVLPEMFTEDRYLENTMEYIYRDLCFAKKQGWFEKFNL